MRLQNLIKASALVLTTVTLVVSPVSSRLAVPEKIHARQEYAESIYGSDEGFYYTLPDWIYDNFKNVKNVKEEDSKVCVQPLDYFLGIREAMKNCKRMNSEFRIEPIDRKVGFVKGLIEECSKPNKNGVPDFTVRGGTYNYALSTNNDFESVPYPRVGRIATGLYGSVMVGNDIYSNKPKENPADTILVGTDISNPIDITEHVICATSGKKYLTSGERKTFFYVSGLMDTLENARQLKSTVLTFTASHTGQARIRIVVPNRQGYMCLPFCGLDGSGVNGDYSESMMYEVYDLETNKKVKMLRGTGGAAISIKGEEQALYDAFNIEKGKKYGIVFNSNGTEQVKMFELFTMKYASNDVFYKRNKWYVRTVSDIDGSCKDIAKFEKERSIKVYVKQKSKIVFQVQSLSSAEEGDSKRTEAYGIFSKKKIDNGVVDTSLKVVYPTKKEFSTKKAKIEFVVDKGTYYIPISWCARSYDVLFKYTVTPIK